MTDNSTLHPSIVKRTYHQTETVKMVYMPKIMQ